MTNANISAAVDTVSGQKLTLTYKGGEQTVTIDKATPIVTFAPGELGRPETWRVGGHFRGSSQTANGYL